MDIYGNLEQEDKGCPFPTPFILGIFLAVLILLFIDLFVG